MIDSAEQTAVHGKHANRQLVDNIHSAAKDVGYFYNFFVLNFIMFTLTVIYPSFLLILSNLLGKLNANGVFVLCLRKNLGTH